MIGRRIRRMRKMRKMTCRELGISVGFKSDNADIRITQYESGARHPKSKLSASIANALDVSPQVLQLYDVNTKEGLLCTLYELDEIYGVSFLERDGRIFFSFNNLTKADAAIKKWAKMRKEYIIGAISSKEYNDWRYRDSLGEGNGSVNVEMQDDFDEQFDRLNLFE